LPRFLDQMRCSAVDLPSGNQLEHPTTAGLGVWRFGLGTPFLLRLGLGVFWDVWAHWETERRHVEGEESDSLQQAHAAAWRILSQTLLWPLEASVVNWVTRPDRPLKLGPWVCWSLPGHLVLSMPVVWCLPLSQDLLYYFLIGVPLRVVSCSAAACHLSSWEAFKAVLRLPQPWRTFGRGIHKEISILAHAFFVAFLDGMSLEFWQSAAEIVSRKAKHLVRRRPLVVGLTSCMLLGLGLRFRKAVGSATCQAIVVVTPDVISAGMHLLASHYFGPSPLELHRHSVEHSRSVMEVRALAEQKLERLVKEAVHRPAQVEVNLEDVNELPQRVLSGHLARVWDRRSAGTPRQIVRTLGRIVWRNIHHEQGAFRIDEQIDENTEASPQKVYVTGCSGDGEVAFRMMGEYHRIEDHHRRPAYKGEHFLLHFLSQGCWALRCIDHGWEDACFAFVQDDAMSPLDVKSVWSVYDLHTHEFTPEPGLHVSDVETAFLRRLRLLKVIHEEEVHHALDDREERWSLVIRRSHLVESSVSAVVAATPSQLLAHHLEVDFQGEDAIDMGGPMREWLDLLGRELAAGHTLSHVPHLASDKAWHMTEQLSDLWDHSRDGMLLPKPGDEDRLQFFVAVGRLLALSLRLSDNFPLPLSLIVYKCILEQPVTAEDIQQLDPDFYMQRLERLLIPRGADTLAEMLGERLTFMSAGTSWRSAEVPLVKGGETMQVTEENKQRYAVLLSEDYLVGGIREELAAISNGFYDLLPQDMLRQANLSAWDLQRLIEGASHVDVEQLRESSQWAPETEEPPQLFNWFFEVAKEFTPENLAQLLQFTTGSSRLPLEGPRALRPPFKVSVNEALEPALLPTSHTCANMICLPLYPSKEVLKTQLLAALESGTGFGFL